MTLTVAQALSEEPEVLEEILRAKLADVAGLSPRDVQELAPAMLVIADRVAAFGDLAVVARELATAIAVAGLEEAITDIEQGGQDGVK